MHDKTYAVWWQEGSGPRHAGGLKLGQLHLLLSRNSPGGLAVPLDQIAAIHYRGGELEIERRSGAHLRIGNLDGVGALLELSDALSAVA